MAPLCVIGIGSPHGDDQVGWRAAEWLSGMGLPLSGCTVLTSAVGLEAILAALAAAEAVIFIDAVRSGAQPGTLHRFTLMDLPAPAAKGLSSHALDPAQALDLTEALYGRRPACIIYGAEAACTEPGAPFSAAVEAALPELVRRVMSELVESAESAGDFSAPVP